MAQYKEFSSFVEERAKHSDYDFVFVFSRLRMERAFHYVATAQQVVEGASNHTYHGVVLSIPSTLSDFLLLMFVTGNPFQIDNMTT